MASKLDTYRGKRDFTKTPEPSGEGREAGVRSGEHLRFVIHKHDARRLHYDLRLETDGVFRSWAVTRGPSLDTRERRLAVEVEDHPLTYGDFEGTIPEGEYGGGTVMIWDRGFWAPETDEPIVQSLRKGELKFALAGSKLKGGWVLVRMKGKEGDTRSNWLLIKHRDRWANDKRDVLKQGKSIASGRTMAEIAKGRPPSPSPFVTKSGYQDAAAVWGETKQPDQKYDDGSFSLSMPRLTNPERVLWPDKGYTKRDLAEYLTKVAPLMIAHLRGRPCSLLRAPNGIGEGTFFQRHIMPGMPKGLSQLRTDDDDEPYLQIDDAQTIVDLAQMSAIEFHPWNCAPFRHEFAGRLVFDLDPGSGVAFDDIVEAARLVRDQLSAVGLVAFCKTTGGKGLHVVTPLTGRQGAGLKQAKLFAQAIATKIASDNDGRFVTKMSKSLRKGRIFIDYLRNDTKATAVAPFSPRARPGALVSMPLNWPQVRKGLDPTRFDIKTAPELFKKSGAWADYDDSARSLSDAISMLLET